jgi:CRISPR-associated protein Cas5d
LALREVAYLIRASPEVRPAVDSPAAKFRDQFRRRVARGQCWATPYLGCREFGAAFAEPDGSESPIAINDDLGRMLLDVDYERGRDGRPTGRGSPRFFHAHLQGGVLGVPTATAEG